MMVILLIQKISRIHSEIEVVWKMLSILALAKWLKDFFLIQGFPIFFGEVGIASWEDISFFGDSQFS